MAKIDKWQALQQFWSSFGIPAYDRNSVPDDATMPYITYDATTGSLDDMIPATADVWYFGKSWKDISLKVDEIAEVITRGGKVIPINNNDEYVWVCRGVPFAQRMPDENDNVKRVYLVLNIEFLTKN